MPQPLIIPDVASLPDYVGTELGMSDWHRIDQAKIDAFADATGDQQWIHVDVERARQESPFGTTIAHGYLTIALAPALLPEIVEIAQCSRILNVGIDRVRLREPVTAGSRIRLGGSVKNVRAMKGGAMRLALEIRFEAEDAKRPVCTGELLFLYFP
jgi:acyl dehydratase